MPELSSLAPFPPAAPISTPDMPLFYDLQSVIGTLCKPASGSNRATATPCTSYPAWQLAVLPPGGMPDAHITAGVALAIHSGKSYKVAGNNKQATAFRPA